MLRYGFFDSEITGFDTEGMPIFDRAESSDFLAMFISQIISDGVLALPGDCFHVIAYDGMTVKVRPGFGIVKGRFAFDTKDFEITLANAPTTYKRIDRIVLRVNYLQRLCEIVPKTGTPDASPQPPELIRPASGDYYELCLATISINSNQTVITQANINDTRYDSAVCGIVTQVIDHLDTSVFYAQFNAFYQEFVEKSNTTFEEFKQKAINLYNSYVDVITEYTDNLKNDADAIYEIYLSDIRTLYNEFKENGQQEYDSFHTEITEYIEELKNRGETRLATITQQLLDFRDVNEAGFLKWLETLKGLANGEDIGQLLVKVASLESQQEDMMEMLLSGNVYGKLVTDDGNYIIDDKGIPILVGGPICKCEK